MIRIIVFSICVFFGYNQVFAQNYVNVKISDGKTTHLIFPTDVKYFDYGSEDVGVEETTEPNIIKVKAAVQNFPNTNLTVMTSDNVFYSFILEYDQSPKQLNYFIKDTQGIKYMKSENNQSAQGETATKNNPGTNSKDSISAELKTDLIQFDLLKRINTDGFIAGTRNSRITLVLKEILVDKDNLYLILDAKNETAINYDIEFIKFFIKPKRQRKQSTIQDIEVTPLNSVNVPKVLVKNPEGLTYFSFALKKLTIADDKKFVVEMWEKNGERSVELEISNKVLLKAKNLSSI